MIKHYLVHVNNSATFLYKTEETAKIKRILTRRMSRMDHCKPGELTTGQFMELKRVGVNEYKNTWREVLVWLSNAVFVTWEPAEWDNDRQVWVACQDIYIGPAQKNSENQ